MTLPDRRLSTAEVQDLIRPLENDLVAFYRLVSDAAEDLLDKAVSEGWTPEQLIDELDRMIGGDNRAAETTAVPALEDLRVNKSQEDAMPVPKPKSGESEQDFVSRVIPELINSGKPQDQAAEIAHSEYNRAEKARSVGGFESPEPGDIPESEKKLLADVYAKYRKEGMSKEESAKRAWGAVHSARKDGPGTPVAQRFIQEAQALGVDPGEFYAGIITESKEHDVSLAEGAKIALDHLRKEDPEYYSKLKAVGL